MDGLWDSPDLTALIRVAARNAATFDAWRRRFAFARVPVQALRGVRVANDRDQSRHDISAHYDLGNDLFELMLDETMMYSCAHFGESGMSLADASVAKLELVCSKLGLGPEDHVVEIGTGWGGFAVHAASTRGCRVTTTTISAEQYEYAAARVARGGARGPGDRASAGLPRRAGAVRQARLDRDDRGRRLARLRDLFPALLAAAGARRRDAAAGDRDRRPRLRGREGLAQLHPHLHLPPRVPAVARGDRALGRASDGHADGRARGPDAALRGDAARVA